MDKEKALNNLRLSIYMPVYFAAILLVFEIGHVIFGALPDFNRLFSIMSPLSTISGILIIFGFYSIRNFKTYKKIEHQSS